MRFATVRRDGTTVAVRVEGEVALELPGTDLGQVLRDGRLAAARPTGSAYPIDQAELAPVVVWPSKIVCVGLNYRTHITEVGRQIPAYPTLFAKYPDTLIGPRDDIELPMESQAVDWEGELAVVIGRSVRRASPRQARDAIAGYSVINDVTVRDYQHRTLQWLQGKTWEATSPFGPVLVTPDELPPNAALTTAVDGQTVQHSTINDLVFGATELVEYVSRIVTLRPGDVIATGTPGGVGHARKPPRYLRPGQILTTSIEGIGELTNRVVAARDTRPGELAVPHGAGR
jgi:acylpyruvate hydrolase